MPRPIPFTFTGSLTVRSLLIDENPWFVAADVGVVLSLGNPRSSLALLDDDERAVHIVDTPGGQQSVTVINESGLYSLILRSRKPEAKAFKKWITSEVLPALRKTGTYSVQPKPNREHNPPWPLPEDEYLPINGAERAELSRLVTLVRTSFRFKNRASWWLNKAFKETFGCSVRDVPRWQYPAAHQWLQTAADRSAAFGDAVDHLEHLFWDSYGKLSPQATVSLDTRRGLVFSDPVRDQRAHRPQLR